MNDPVEVTRREVAAPVEHKRLNGRNDDVRACKVALMRAPIRSGRPRVSYSSASLSNAWVAYGSNTARAKARYLSAFCLKNCAPLLGKSIATLLLRRFHLLPMRRLARACGQGDVAPSASAASHPRARSFLAAYCLNRVAGAYSCATVSTPIT
jgi:hypothetical protein